MYCRKSTASRKDSRQHRRVGRRYMQNDEHSRGQTGRKSRNESLQRLDTTGGRSDDDNVRIAQLRSS